MLPISWRMKRRLMAGALHRFDYEAAVLCIRRGCRYPSAWWLWVPMGLALVQYLPWRGLAIVEQVDAPSPELVAITGDLADGRVQDHPPTGLDGIASGTTADVSMRWSHTST